MTTCVERNPVNNLCIGQAPYKIKDRVDSLASSQFQPSRNVFTTCHVSQHPNALEAKAFLDAHCPPFRRDLATQRVLVRHSEQAAVCERVERYESAARLSETDREISVKALLRAAASRDVRLALASRYPPDALRFIRRTWQSFLWHVADFFRRARPEPHGAGQEALENVSSIGVWFAGAMSVPLRRYRLRLADPPREVEAVGLVAFAYSSYVIDARRWAQCAALAELERLSARLAVRLRFLPALVLPVAEPREPPAGEEEAQSIGGDE